MCFRRWYLEAKAGTTGSARTVAVRRGALDHLGHRVSTAGQRILWDLERLLPDDFPGQIRQFAFLLGPRRSWQLLLRLTADVGQDGHATGQLGAATRVRVCRRGFQRGDLGMNGPCGWRRRRFATRHRFPFLRTSVSTSLNLTLREA